MITREKLIREWVSALRSGKYKQVKGALATDGGYCCLGVLCEVAIENGIAIGKTEYPDHYEYNGNDQTLPTELQDLMGFNQIGVFEPYQEPKDSLAELNDEGSSFEEIADIIEEIEQQHRWV